MNQLDELALHAAAVRNAVAEEPKFFAAISAHVLRLSESLEPGGLSTKEELTILAKSIDKFFEDYRASPLTDDIG